MGTWRRRGARDIVQEHSDCGPVYCHDRDLNHAGGAPGHRRYIASRHGRRDTAPGPDGLVRIWLDRKFVERLGRMRNLGETYSDVILRLAACSSTPLRSNPTAVHNRDAASPPQPGGSSMPLKRMLNDSRAFEPKAVALLLETFDEIVADLDLRIDADREKAAKPS